MNTNHGSGDSPGNDKDSPESPVRIPRVNCDFNCGTCGECGRILDSKKNESSSS